MATLELWIEPVATPDSRKWHWKLSRKAHGKTDSVVLGARKEAVTALTEQIVAAWSADYKTVIATLIDQTGAGERVTYHADHRMTREILPARADLALGIGPRCSALPNTEEEKQARREAMKMPKKGKAPKAEKPPKPPKAEKPKRGRKPEPQPEPFTPSAIPPVLVPMGAVPIPAVPTSVQAYLLATSGGTNEEQAAAYLAGFVGGKRASLTKAARRHLSGPARALFDRALSAARQPEVVVVERPPEASLADQEQVFAHPEEQAPILMPTPVAAAYSTYPHKRRWQPGGSTPTPVQVPRGARPGLGVPTPPPRATLPPQEVPMPEPVRTAPTPPAPAPTAQDDDAAADAELAKLVAMLRANKKKG